MLDGKIVVGCSTSIDPEGQTDKEWCKLQNVDQGEKDWGYCLEDLDFDQVRLSTAEFYEEDIKIIK